MYTKHAYALNFKAAFETLLQEESKQEKMFKISDVNSIPRKAETNELFFPRDLWYFKIWNPEIDFSRDRISSIELSPSTSYMCFTPPTGNLVALKKNQI